MLFLFVVSVLRQRLKCSMMAFHLLSSTGLLKSLVMINWLLPSGGFGEAGCHSRECEMEGSHSLHDSEAKTEKEEVKVLLSHRGSSSIPCDLKSLSRPYLGFNYLPIVPNRRTKHLTWALWKTFQAHTRVLGLSYCAGPLHIWMVQCAMWQLWRAGSPWP